MLPVYFTKDSSVTIEPDVKRIGSQVFRSVPFE